MLCLLLEPDHGNYSFVSSMDQVIVLKMWTKVGGFFCTVDFITIIEAIAYTWANILLYKNQQFSEIDNPHPQPLDCTSFNHSHTHIIENLVMSVKIYYCDLIILELPIFP